MVPGGFRFPEPGRLERAQWRRAVTLTRLPAAMIARSTKAECFPRSIRIKHGDGFRAQVEIASMDAGTTAHAAGLHLCACHRICLWFRSYKKHCPETAKSAPLRLRDEYRRVVGFPV